MSVDGRAVGLEPVLVPPGALLVLDGQPYRFIDRLSGE
jgi:hypothetical protein